jgi:hypothetical protein
LTLRVLFLTAFSVIESASYLSEHPMSKEGSRPQGTSPVAQLRSAFLTHRWMFLVEYWVFT